MRIFKRSQTNLDGADRESTKSKLIRRVASAPNTNKLFKKSSSSLLSPTQNITNTDNKLYNTNHNASDNTISTTSTSTLHKTKSDYLQQSQSQDKAENLKLSKPGFRRTYSSNSIKTREVSRLSPAGMLYIP